jgi:RNA polymerase sigma-70 factor (ECF subfamily)
VSSVIGQPFIDDLALRHLDAAYNLGRWLLGNEHEATDAVHDAYLRAVRSAATYAGGNERAWWLTIVRNCCLARLEARNKGKRDIAIDEGSTAPERWMPRSDADEIENRIDSAQRQNMVTRYLQELPLNFREVLILREIEELSYREIADVLEMPIGTVMSRLARGRAMLQKSLAEHATMQAPHGL